MIGAQEEDRRRVAYDIHDGLAQLMVSRPTLTSRAYRSHIKRHENPNPTTLSSNFSH
jgi:signal transduction histidine kinase